MKYPTKVQLIAALTRAGELHHSYEKVYLAGERDERWAGFYAAYVLGRYGDFERPELVAEQLEKTPVSENWAADAAEAVLQSGSGRAVSSGDEQAREVMYVCPHCFTASDTPGNCGVCGYQLFEFRPGDIDDPCRCPVINEQGEVVTHAPLWWLRSVAPELAERMEQDQNKTKN